MREGTRPRASAHHPSARSAAPAQKSSLMRRLLEALLLSTPAPRVQRERAYRSTTPQQAKAIRRRRAKNKVARRSRRINRMRAR